MIYHNSNQPFPSLLMLLSFDPPPTPIYSPTSDLKKNSLLKICSGCDRACLTRWLSQSNKGRILSKTHANLCSIVVMNAMEKVLKEVLPQITGVTQEEIVSSQIRLKINLTLIHFYNMLNGATAFLTLFKSGLNDSLQNSLFVFFAPFVTLNNTRLRLARLTISCYLGLLLI